MGVLRFPRPSGIYVPYSSSQSLTTDMISPPLSPGIHGDSDAITASIIPALEYISSKLQQKHLHVTLLVGRGAPFPSSPSSNQMMVIPVASLDESDRNLLHRVISKAARKFGLGSGWADALSQSQYERHAQLYLIQQSIRQNEVLFSDEGLTLLSMDRIYTFKRRLCILSHQYSSMSDADAEPYIASCVQLLHRTIADFQGRPFSKAFFHRIYEQLNVHDDLLAQVGRAYQAEHGQEGIIFPRPAQQPLHSETAAAARPRRSRKCPPPTASNMPKLVKRGPKTPLSASDVTPTTQNEWDMIAPGERCFPKMTVTKWTPSPIVFVGA